MSHQWQAVNLLLAVVLGRHLTNGRVIYFTGDQTLMILTTFIDDEISALHTLVLYAKFIQRIIHYCSKV